MIGCRECSKSRVYDNDMGSSASTAAQRNKLHKELVKIGSGGIDVPAYPSRPFPCSLPQPPVRIDQVSSGTAKALPCLALPHMIHL